MPTYPLNNINVLLFLATTTLNVLYMVKSVLNYIAIIFILAVFVALFRTFRNMRLPQNDCWADFNLQGGSDLLAETDLHPLFFVHLFLVLLVFLLLIILASKNLYMSKRVLADFAKLQIDRLYEVMGYESQAYVVMKLTIDFSHPDSTKLDSEH